MAIIKRPFHELSELLEVFGRTSLNLATNVYEDKSNVVVQIQVPDIDPNKIEITVSDHHVYIRGEREEEKETEKRHYHHKEIRYGTFERIIELPHPVIAIQAQATYGHGKLVITIPKTTMQKNSKVRVTKKNKNN